jgi:hypothetical protein
MFGASLAGFVVSLAFSREANHTLNQEGIADMQVRHLFDSPQLLVRSADQTLLGQLAQQQHFDAVTLLSQARLGLAQGIREAFVACLVLALVSYFISRRLPPFARQKTTAAENETAE